MSRPSRRTFYFTAAPGLLLLAAFAIAQSPPASGPATHPAAPPLSDVDAYPYVAGTQTISPAYQFTAEPKLVETASAIRDMGSNTIKFAIRPDYFGPGGNVPKKDPAVHTLTELARDEPAHR